MSFFEYYPSKVNLPNDLTRDYLCCDHLGKKIPQEENNQYDYSTFFHDVFFSEDKKYIWAVGALLYLLEKKLLPFQVFWKKQKIFTEFIFNKHITIAKINAENIITKTPTLFFCNDIFSFTVKVNYINFKTPAKLVISVIQKNYSTEHILHWILWHYKLYDFHRIMFYDNNSQNKKQVIAALKSIAAEKLEVIFINWDYRFKNQLTSLPAFCQITQLNHSLKLHYNQDIFVANLDMDEFLVKTKPKNPKTNNIIIPIYDLPFIISKNKKTDNTLDKFSIRNKYYRGYKFFYIPQKIIYISNVHNIYYKNQTKYYQKKFSINRKYARFFQRLRKCFLLILHLFFTPKIYAVHAHCLKVLWKSKGYHPFYRNYSKFLHIEDKNITNLFKKAGLYRKK